MLIVTSDWERGESVVRRYYDANTENGNHIDDPSEDALYELVEDLNDTDNTFVIVSAADEALTWWASVARREEGGFEVVRRDPSRHEHEVEIQHRASHIAKDLTIWLAGRSF